MLHLSFFLVAYLVHPTYAMARKIYIQILIVVFGSLVIGFAFNQFNTGGVPLWGAGESITASTNGGTHTPAEILSKTGKTLSLEEAFVLHQAHSAVFIDARPPSFYKSEHIEDAISVYYKTAGLNPVLDKLAKNDPFVVYCKGPNCNQAQLLIATMHKAGFTRVFLFPGGMQEWRLAQYPMNRTP